MTVKLFETILILVNKIKKHKNLKYVLTLVCPFIVNILAPTKRYKSSPLPVAKTTVWPSKGHSMSDETERNKHLRPVDEEVAHK